jgi:2,3-dihydroxybiphenyl 1,2-dioxygenase
MDHRQYRIVLHPDAEDGLRYLGWELARQETFEATVERLRAAGHEVALAGSEQCAERGVRALATLKDPAGYDLQLFYGPMQAELPFMPTRPISGFVAGSLGAGHAVLRVPDMEQALAFYRDLLGFRVSDQWSGMLTFLRCNPRHHSLALVEAPGPRLLYHTMVEVQSLDDVGKTLTRCEQTGTEVTMSLGRHTNDHMVSFYLRSPSGFEIEYGCEGRSVDESTWSVEQFTARSTWGHRPLVPRELVAPGDAPETEAEAMA